MDASALQGRRVVVGVGGGIAAYKACELVRELRRAGAEVRVAMTEAAQGVRHAADLPGAQRAPRAHRTTSIPTQEANFGHLDLARWAELYVVAPATADLLARIRAGMAGDAVTTSLLAFEGPVLLAPAMNVAMWENRLTQENLAALARGAALRVRGARERGCSPAETWGRGGWRRCRTIVRCRGVAARRGAACGQARADHRGAHARVPGSGAVHLQSLDREDGAGARGGGARARGEGDGGARAGGQRWTARGSRWWTWSSAEEMAREVLARVESVDVFIASAAVSDWRPETPRPRR